MLTGMYFNTVRVTKDVSSPSSLTGLFQGFAPHMPFSNYYQVL